MNIFKKIFVKLDNKFELTHDDGELKYSTKMLIFIVVFLTLFQITFYFIMTPEIKEFMSTQILVAALSTSFCAVFVSLWMYKKSESEIGKMRDGLLNKLGMKEEDIEKINKLMPLIRKTLKMVEEVDIETALPKIEQAMQVYQKTQNKWDDDKSEFD